MPVVVGTAVQTLYNIIDTAYVGRIGADALAAISFSFPVFFILIAINAGLSTGMTSRIARSLGEKKKKEAENAALHGLLLSVIVGFLVAGIGIIFLKEIFALFGATGNILQLAVDYTLIILYGILFMFFSYMFNGIFSAQGDTKTPMKIMVTTLIINIILDPIFIFALGWGIKGAAIATVISFFVGLILFLFAIHTKSYLHIHM
ncbi:MAG: MATE family efflux transporter, partial [Nanoarchaeota archaeon]|nr:MATE family efflux transporter [Nanoarchaeota archaeon]